MSSMGRTSRRGRDSARCGRGQSRSAWRDAPFGRQGKGRENGASVTEKEGAGEVNGPAAAGQPLGRVSRKGAKSAKTEPREGPVFALLAPLRETLSRKQVSCG